MDGRQITTGGIHEVLTALIRTYEDDAAIVELAAASLWPSVVGRAAQQSAAVRAGVAPPLLKTMSSAPRAKQLQVRLDAWFSRTADGQLSIHNTSTRVDVCERAVMYFPSDSCVSCTSLCAGPWIRHLQYRLCGCLLALALDNPQTQELLARESVREGIRAALMNNPSIGFDGQFESLKEWMRAPSGSGSSDATSYTDITTSYTERSISQSVSRSSSRRPSTQLGTAEQTRAVDSAPTSSRAATRREPPAARGDAPPAPARGGAVTPPDQDEFDAMIARLEEGSQVCGMSVVTALSA